MKKRVLTLVLAVLMIFSFIGCSDPTLYDGSHPELFVVATHSLLGVWGGWGEVVLVLEEDAFGRVLFAYAGFSSGSDIGGALNILAVLVSQRTTETHSYFYSGINVISHEIAMQVRDFNSSASEFLSEDFVMEHFTEEEIAQLKAGNSWNEELDEDRFFRARISRRRKSLYMTNVSEEALREAYLAVVEIDSFNAERDSIPLTMDKNGNIIFFIQGRRFEPRVTIRYPTFLFMFDADGNLIEGTGVMELIDLWDYCDQLREFKEANGWSFYYR